MVKLLIIYTTHTTLCCFHLVHTECKCYLMSVKHMHLNMDWNSMKIRVLYSTLNDIDSRLTYPSATYINGSLMKTDMFYTYLGHIINNNLNDNKDIERQLRNFYGKSNILLSTFGSYLYGVKLQLFMSYFNVHIISLVWLHTKEIPTIGGSL